MPATARPTQAHSHAGGQAGAKPKPTPKLYNPRHPERTLLYQTIAEHFETWFGLASAGQFDGQGDYHASKPYVRQAFCKYLECGPPLWDDCSGAQSDDGAQIEPADWDLAAQPAPDFGLDQRISW